MDTDHDILMRVDLTTTALHDELIGSRDREGRIPKIETKLDAHDSQINFWRGAIAVLAFGLLALGGAVVAHLFGVLGAR